MYGILGITMPAISSTLASTKQLQLLQQMHMYPAAGDYLYGALKFIYFVFMFAVILGIAYVTTKYIAKKGVSKGSNRNLKVVETLGLGIDKSLMLVRVGEQYFLLSNSAKAITLLTPVDGDKLNLPENSELYGSVNKNVDEYLSSLDGSTGPEAYLGTVKQSLSKLKSIVRGSKADE